MYVYGPYLHEAKIKYMLVSDFLPTLSKGAYCVNFIAIIILFTSAGLSGLRNGPAHEGETLGISNLVKQMV